MFGILGGLGPLFGPLQSPPSSPCVNAIAASLQNQFAAQYQLAQQQHLSQYTPEIVFSCLLESEMNALSPAAILAFSSGAFPDELVDELRLVIGRRYLP